jgi:NTP pyrophosphatase (non-canonical NTP hydrolase)
VSGKTAKQSDKTFQEIADRIYRHLEERDWLDNTPRSLAISKSNELLEHYQLHDKPVGDKTALAEELADIFIYAFEFANSQGIDIPAAIEDKLVKAAMKYPAENFKNKSKEEREQSWLDSKRRHQKEGL